MFVVDAHASVRKAAALVGLGRKSVVECGREGELGLFDSEMLEERLRRNWEEGRGSIVSVSFGEVNTGCASPFSSSLSPLSMTFLTDSLASPTCSYISPQTPQLRTLCDMYHSWLHLDAAFSAFATLSPLFAHYKPHLALGDSITSDAHKWLNVPYDCGLFFSKRRRVRAGEEGGEVGLWEVTGPGKAGGPAYLAQTASKKQGEDEVDYPLIEESKALPSPLFMGIENSRRLYVPFHYPSFSRLTRPGGWMTAALSRSTHPSSPSAQAATPP